MQPSATRWYDFAADPAGRVGIRAGSECLLEVLDLSRGVPLHRFESNLSPSGRLAVNADGTRCLTGGWSNPNGAGVCCFEVASGALAWRRRDLKQPQAVLHDTKNNGWIVSLDRGGTHLLDAESGRTLGRIKGAGFGSRVTYCNSEDAYLCIRRARLELLDAHSLAPRMRFKVPVLWRHLEADSRVPSGFTTKRVSLTPARGAPCEKSGIIGALAIAHGDGRLIVSIGCGPLLCFSRRTGALLWNIEQTPGFALSERRRFEQARGRLCRSVEFQEWGRRGDSGVRHEIRRRAFKGDACWRGLVGGCVCSRCPSPGLRPRRV
jgi:hypothetical protein